MCRNAKHASLYPLPCDVPITQPLLKEAAALNIPGLKYEPIPDSVLQTISTPAATTFRELVQVAFMILYECACD